MIANVPSSVPASVPTGHPSSVPVGVPPFRDVSRTRTRTRVVVALVCGVSGEDQIQSDRHLGPLSAPIGFGDLR